MELEQNWAEALNINPEKLAEWSAQVPDGMPLLVWCLEQNHVPVQKYLAWACERFGMPVLNAGYFSETFDRANFEHERKVGSWNPWFFPVGKWDDVTLVACVEPPAERPEGKFAFVLADPKILNQVWGPEAMVTSEFSTDRVQVDLKALDAPVGVNLNAASTFQLNLDSVGLVSHAEPPAVAPEPPKAMAAPATMASPEARFEAPAPFEESAIDESSLSVVLDSDPGVEPIELTGSVMMDMVVEVSEPSVADAPPPAPPAPKKPVAEARVALAPPPPIPAHSPPPQVTKAVGTAADVKSASARAPINSTEDFEMKTAFDKLKKDYDFALVMRCSETVAMPYKWDSDLNLPEDVKNIAVNLSYPSFFRIVAKTLLPYHGYVVDSPAHREFFSHLNLKAPPTCVTAIPLKAEGSLWGVLVAIGNESSQGPDALLRMQKVADKLTHALEASWVSSAA